MLAAPEAYVPYAVGDVDAESWVEGGIADVIERRRGVSWLREGRWLFDDLNGLPDDNLLDLLPGLPHAIAAA